VRTFDVVLVYSDNQTISTVVVFPLAERPVERKAAHAEGGDEWIF